MIKKIKAILKQKGKLPITCLTAYSKPTAEIIDKYCDITLVGDSVSQVLYGMKSTREISLYTMMMHAKSVKNSTKKSLVVFDMPYKTYTNKFIALKNALKVLKLTKCDAIKLEGGKNKAQVIKYLVKKGIPVMGHVGLLPQSSKKFTFKGKNLNQKIKIYEDAISIANSGAFAIVLECVVGNLAKKITRDILIPTIGIGSSKYCDGQILVIDDMIGLSNFHPKFVKKYLNVRKKIEAGVKKYATDVKLKKFPSKKHTYN